MIKKDKSGYKVVSKKGKNLGSGYKTRAEAAKRLRQVEFFKRKKAEAGGWESGFHASDKLFSNLLDNPLRFPFAACAIPLGDSKGGAQDHEGH